MCFPARKPDSGDVQAEERRRCARRTRQGKIGPSAQPVGPDRPWRGIDVGRRRVCTGWRRGQNGRGSGGPTVVYIGRVRVGFRR